MYFEQFCRRYFGEYAYPSFCFFLDFYKKMLYNEIWKYFCKKTGV